VVVTVFVVVFLVSARSFMTYGDFGNRQRLGPLGSCEVKAQLGTAVLLSTGT
jgi:hypothetical protein